MIAFADFVGPPAQIFERNETSYRRVWKIPPTRLVAGKFDRARSPGDGPCDFSTTRVMIACGVPRLAPSAVVLRHQNSPHLLRK